jgi:hypothetical protein
MVSSGPKALLMVISPSAEPGLPARLIHCKVCKEPLTATDSEYALKYFLVQRPNERNGFDLQMKHSAPRA